MPSARTSRSFAWRIVGSALAVIALAVCFVTPFHAHERNDATCVVCHVATAPALTPAIVPCIVPVLVTALHCIAQPARPDAPDLTTAVSRGPPSLLPG